MRTRQLMPTSRLAAASAGLCLLAGAGLPGTALARDGGGSDTASPIEHLVVIFQENVSFDHYFATYPVALNLANEPFFQASDDTPSVNGLGALINGQRDGVLLTDNPNRNNPANGTNAINPFRLSRSQAATCDQDHNYGHEQQAFNQGLMDLFPLSVGVGSCNDPYNWGKGNGLVMGYFDGNTVTALWNYAQRFAMNENSFGTGFGPSTPGLLNLVAGNTYPATVTGTTSAVVAINNGVGTVVGDPDPTGDVCSTTTGATVQLGGNNIGDLLNAKNVTWGAFMGGFDLTVTNPNGTTGCQRSSTASPSNSTPTTSDYIPHHAFLQYYASTINPNHVRPNSLANIGTSHDGGANHEYDLHDFFGALKIGNMPAVSFLKAIAAADGHAGYSNPLLEQDFLVRTVNAVMRSPFWRSTAIIILYDDSDGWYDHQMSPIVNSSAVKTGSTANSDELNGDGVCGHGTPLEDANGNLIQGRCGYGPRQPLLVISPFAKRNFVDHTLTDQSSVLRFIEDNWGTGGIGGGSYDNLAGSLLNMFDFDEHDLSKGEQERRLLLDPTTGTPL